MRADSLTKVDQELHFRDGEWLYNSSDGEWLYNSSDGECLYNSSDSEWLYNSLWWPWEWGVTDIHLASVGMGYY